MSKFWGLNVNVGKRFKQQVQEPFCISGAAVEPIDVASGQYDEKPVQLYLQEDQSEHLLCSLNPKLGILQVPLDVRIGSGETIGFFLKGGSPKTKVHLTGYTLPRQASTLVSPALAEVPFKGQRKSILVTEPRSGDKDNKKRVSIVENEPYGEVESSEEENTTPSRVSDLQGDVRKNIFNGFENDDDDDDDDDDDGFGGGLEVDSEDDDSDDDDEDSMDEDEKEELNQLSKKEVPAPTAGGKYQANIKEDSDSDLELLEDDDEDDDDDDEDDDDDDDSDDDELQVEQTNKSPNNSPKKTSNNSLAKEQKKGGITDGKSPQKQKPETPNKKEVNAVPKTPENKNLKLKTPSSAGHTPMKAFTKGGVLVNEMKVGDGQVARAGRMVSVYYKGRLKSNNKEFDATTSGPGFKFRLGKGEVIRGWDLGVEGMKVGGKRRLTIPAQLAYGKKGAPPDIPPNSTLVFEVELKNVS